MRHIICAVDDAQVQSLHWPHRCQVSVI